MIISPFVPGFVSKLMMNIDSLSCGTKFFLLLLPSLDGSFANVLTVCFLKY